MRRCYLNHLTARHLTTTSAPSPHTPVATKPAKLPTLGPNDLHSYQVTSPPLPYQATFATKTFLSSPPVLLSTSPNFRDLPPSPHPEVVFLGRSNAGKSSLLNALFGRTATVGKLSKDLAHISRKPGRTRSMNAYGVAGELAWGEVSSTKRRNGPGSDSGSDRWRSLPPGGCVVVDMPGYGHASRGEWGVEVNKYLAGRRQLRRVFLLVDTKLGPKKTDLEMIRQLRRAGCPFQVVLSKADKILLCGIREKQKIRPNRLRLNAKLLQKEIAKELRSRVEAAVGPGAMDVLCCSAERTLDMGGKVERIGLGELRWAVLSACGIECDASGTRKKVAGSGSLIAQTNPAERCG